MVKLFALFTAGLLGLAGAGCGSKLGQKCASRHDCSVGQSCSNGTCTKACEWDSDCGNGFACREASGEGAPAGKLCVSTAPVNDPSRAALLATRNAMANYRKGLDRSNLDAMRKLEVRVKVAQKVPEVQDAAFEAAWGALSAEERKGSTDDLVAKLTDTLQKK